MTNFAKTPIVLVHGILGFDRIGLPGFPIEYFNGIPKALRDAGYTVPEPPALPPAGSVEERSYQLKVYLETNEDVRDGQVHIIAHSMGGLDSRYAIAVRGMAHRVLSLTTLGTPHLGTTIADLDISIFGGAIEALDFTQLADLKGFFDLTHTNAQEFLKQTINHEDGVQYFSVAGVYDPNPLDLLKPTHDYILALEGQNDGLVSVKSATFGRYLATWPGNHFRLINWPTNLVWPIEEKFDNSVIQLYLELLKSLESAMSSAT